MSDTNNNGNFGPTHCFQHGVRREKTTEEILKEKKAAELKKIEKYCGLVNQLNEATKDDNFSPVLLETTAKILEVNPEYYTAWFVFPLD